MDFENEIHRVAEQYRSEGYAVAIRPDADRLNGFPAELGADVLASRGTENVVIQVKHTRTDVEADTTIPLRAMWVQSHPGWRYDLVVLEQETPTRRIAGKSVEPNDEEFRAMIGKARLARDSGLSEMALIYAWALLEAAMRSLRDEVELYGRTTPNELLRTLYGNGFLSRSELDLAKAAFTIRTQAVHGFVTPAIDPMMVEALLALTKKIKGDSSDPAKPFAA